MRNWGIAVTVFYALVVLFLALPGWVFVSEGKVDWADLPQLYRESAWWFGVAIPIAGQALLIFLSVDTSRKRLKPRAHTLVSSSMAAMFLAILTFAAILSLVYGIAGDHGDSVFGGWRRNAWFGVLGVWVCLWLFWGILFYRYSRDSATVIARVTSWLLKGSILELLVAVPCHVIVRHRKDCSAPMATGFGITTGIAVMLLSFGPSVLFLYKKRLDASSPSARNILQA